MSISVEFEKMVEDNNFVPMRELVFRYLREAILTGKFRQGDHLIEEELARQMRISRTPIREAIRKLELEGLVKNSPRRGVEVQLLSIDAAAEIYDLRSVLEGYAARLAAERTTPEELTKMKSLLEEMRQNIETGNNFLEMNEHREWHLLLYRSSKNKRLERLLNDYADYLQMFRTVSLRSPGRLWETWEEHERIVRSIELRDGELAERRAREHVIKGKESFLRQRSRLIQESEKEEA